MSNILKNTQKEEIWTNNCGETYNIGKLKEELNRFRSWLGGNHMAMRPFMNVRYDFLQYFLKTLDEEIPFYYHDTCGWINDFHGEQEWFATFFRFYSGAVEWKKWMKNDYPDKFRLYRKI